MTLRKTILGTSAALLPVISPAMAKDNFTCEGKIEAPFPNPYWYAISDDCSFDGDTSYGKKILMTCGVGEWCQVEASGVWEHHVFYIKRLRSVDRIIEGKIASYECGDNCHLTIIDKHNKEHTALCTARECQSWNFQSEMPAFFIGKKVAVTVGKGVAIYGDGETVAGRMDAYTLIRFLGD